jgi:hypothetical protein
MAGLNKISLRAYWALPPAVLAGVLLALWVGQPKTDPAPLKDWDISQLVSYLNEEGLGLRVVSTRKDGAVHQTAYLTTTPRDWDDLNRLQRGRTRIDQWRGTLHCERGPGGEIWADLARQWGDNSLVVGPFLLYGDRELLGRVRAALAAHVRAACWPTRLRWLAPGRGPRWPWPSCVGARLSDAGTPG